MTSESGGEAKGEAGRRARPLRGPAAFVLASGTASGEAAPDRQPVAIRDEPDFVAQETAAPADAPGPPVQRGSWLSTVFWSALGLLLSLYLADGVLDLVQRLQLKCPLVAQGALVLVVAIAGILVFWLLREAMALFCMRRVDGLRREIALARGGASPVTARAAIGRLAAFYAKDASTAAGRAEIVRSEGEVLDAQTLVDLAERALLTAKDQAVRAEIAAAAQRVSLFTALSPRAIVDILFVLAQAFRLIRRISEIYGGRASGLALWRLAARIGEHLVVTGGIAVADSVMGQLMGAGLAARLSAKLGEGVVNGVLTARIGIAAVAVCRPMAFEANAPVILSEVVKTSITQ